MLRWEVHYEVQYEVHYKVQFEHRCFSWRPHTIKMYWKDSKSHNFRFTSLAIQKVHWQFLTRRAFGELIKRLCFQKELAHIQLSRHFFLGLNPRKWFRWNVPLFSIPINSSPRNFSPGKPVPLTQKTTPKHHHNSTFKCKFISAFNFDCNLQVYIWGNAPFFRKLFVLNAVFSVWIFKSVEDLSACLKPVH